MVHRDIKPANIMIDEETGKAILTDFGIVKMIGNQSMAFTATGALIGTPAYMSPEQALGKAGDERVDIYSLGVLLFQMITSQLPFDADTPLAVVMKHVNDPTPMPMTFNPDVPLGLQEVVMKEWRLRCGPSISRLRTPLLQYPRPHQRRRRRPEASLAPQRLQRRSLSQMQKRPLPTHPLSKNDLAGSSLYWALSPSALLP